MAPEAYGFPQPASEGRIVHVRIEGVDHCQPAIVVRAWGDGTGKLNLQVLRDGSNDHEPKWAAPADGSAPTRWATSVAYGDPDEDHGNLQSWHWPERAS